MSMQAVALKARLWVRQQRVNSLLNAAVRHGERADWIEEIIHQARREGWSLPEAAEVTSRYLGTHQRLRALAALQRACDVEDATIRGLLGAEEPVQR